MREQFEITPDLKKRTMASRLAYNEGIKELLIKEHFPKIGMLMSPRGANGVDAFFSVAKELVARGIPQLTKRQFEMLRHHSPKELCDVYICWFVDGVPSREGKTPAGSWMKNRGVDWDGKATSLRHEVERALIAGELVPKFGLHVQCLLFVDGEDPLTNYEDED